MTLLHAVEIRPASDRGNLRSFVQFPYDLYKNHPNWVPPVQLSVHELLSPKHPFAQFSTKQCFLAYSKNKIVGRICAINNTRHHAQFPDEPQTGHFGFFECIEDFRVSEALLRAASTWLKGQGNIRMVGPVSPSLNYEAGLLVDGFSDMPQIMMPYHFPYYQSQFQDFGLSKVKDLLAFKIDPHFPTPEIMKRAVTRMEKSHRVEFKTIDMKHFDDEVKKIKSVVDDAWEENWGNVPFTEQEFALFAKEFKMILKPKLVLIAYIAGDPAGFMATVPDFNQALKYNPSGKLLPLGIFKILLNQRKITRARVGFLGVKKRYQPLGLAPLLIEKSREAFLNFPQFKEAEMSWVLEDNKALIKPLEMIGAVPYKTYRLFEKAL